MTPITRKLSIVSLSNLNIANTAGARNSSSRVRVGVDLGSYNIICLLNIDITHISKLTGSVQWFYRLLSSFSLSHNYS